MVPNPQSISNDYFSFNVGGGVMGFFTNHLGAHADLRYFRAALDHFNFWRASVGISAEF